MPVIDGFDCTLLRLIMKKLHYKDYKNFNSTRVRLTNLDMNSLDFGCLKKCFMKLSNKVAPLKAKFLRANSNFATKEVRKAIMLRIKLRN